MFGKKKVEEPIIYNLDNVPVFDRSRGEFLLDFTSGQKKQLTYALEQGYSIRGFAYEECDERMMQLIIEYAFGGIKRYADKKHPIDKLINDVTLWKIIHANYDIGKTRETIYDRIEGICRALGEGIDIPAQTTLFVSIPKILYFVVAIEKKYNNDLSPILVNAVNNLQKNNDEKAFQKEIKKFFKKAKHAKAFAKLR